jgi:glycosyltransferase involved in cell wall biosynthesis
MALKVLQLCAVDFTVKHFLLPLLGFLKEQGFDVTVACSPGPLFSELSSRGVTLKAIEISRSRNFVRHIRSTWRLYRYLRSEQFDIIHVHTPIASLIGRFAAFLARVPIRIYTAHGFYFHDDMPRMQRRFHIALEKVGAWFGDFVFTQSEEDRQTAIREKISRPDRILTIGNGVNLERFDPAKVTDAEIMRLREEFAIPPGAKVIGMMGRLVREKGYFEYFEAAATVAKQVPDVRFLVIGDVLESDYDNSKLEIERWIHQLGVRDKVIFAGMRDDIPQLLSLMDIYTLPSYREGMPRSIIEAMAMARPVVTTNIRGCREEVVHEETGLIVPPRNSKALARAFLDLLNDPERLQRYGRKGRERAEQYFSEKRVLERQLLVYERLITEKGLAAKR